MMELDPIYQYIYHPKQRRLYCRSTRKRVPTDLAMETLILGSARVWDPSAGVDCTRRVLSRWISQHFQDELEEKSLVDLFAIAERLPKRPPKKYLKNTMSARAALMSRESKRVRGPKPEKPKLAPPPEKKKRELFIVRAERPSLPSGEWSLKQLRSFYGLKSKAKRRLFSGSGLAMEEHPLHQIDLRDFDSVL